MRLVFISFGLASTLGHQRLFPTGGKSAADELERLQKQPESPAESKDDMTCHDMTKSLVPSSVFNHEISWRVGSKLACQSWNWDGIPTCDTEVFVPEDQFNRSLSTHNIYIHKSHIWYRHLMITKIILSLYIYSYIIVYSFDYISKWHLIYIYMHR